MPSLSRVEIAIYKASSDGLYWGRYPNGDKPPGLIGAALVAATATAALMGGPASLSGQASVASTVHAILSPPGQAKNWTSGHWMGSNNVNGTGSPNQTEINALAAGIAAGAPIQGWVGIYQWRSLEPTQASTVSGYNIAATMAADFQYLQQKCPGAHYGALIWAEQFSGTTAQSCGTPDYILGSTSLYGAGQDGTHSGYWSFNFGAGNQGGTAALWRGNVNTRYQALMAAIAATPTDPVNRPGMTFGNDPLVEVICDQETSLSLSTGSDYTDAALVTQTNSLHQAMAIDFTAAQIGPQLNYVANQGNMAALLDNSNNGAFNLKIAMSGPDVYPSAPAHLTWGQGIYTGLEWNGSAFVTGGTDLRTKSMPCIGMVQQATTTHFAGTTPAQLLASMQYLQCTHMVWVYLVGGAFDWSSVMVPFIKANPFSAPYPTGYYAS